MTDRPHPYESPAMIATTGATIRPGGLSLTERALDFCAFRPGDRVLDVGCGLGASVGFMREYYGLEACGVDLSPTLVSQGLARSPGLPLQVADAAALPFPDGGMDGVLMECVLSLTGAVDRVLAEAYRVLKPKGRLMLADMYPREIPPLPRGGEHGLCPGHRAGRTQWGDYSGLPCMAGTLLRAKLEREVAGAGFEVSLWEDHTKELKSLAAEIILKHGSLSGFWALVYGCSQERGPRESAPRDEGAAGREIATAAGKAGAVGREVAAADGDVEAASGLPDRRPGYFLAIAVRR